MRNQSFEQLSDFDTVASLAGDPRKGMKRRLTDSRHPPPDEAWGGPASRHSVDKAGSRGSVHEIA